jgi:excisionase family DNA binding protein
MDKPISPLIGRKALAKLLGVHVDYIARLQAEKSIPFLQPGKRKYLFDPEKVMAALGKFESKVRKPLAS